MTNFKTRLLLAKLNRTIQKCYIPHQNVAVDESMVNLKGDLP